MRQLLLFHCPETHIPKSLLKFTSGDDYHVTTLAVNYENIGRISLKRQILK